MSDGHKKSDMEPTYITMDPDEFNRVCKRLHEMLSSRVQDAWDRKDKRPTSRMINNHIEACKDAYAFIHLIDLVEHMSQEIYELRTELEDLGLEDDSEYDDPPQMWIGSQPKKFLN